MGAQLHVGRLLRSWHVAPRLAGTMAELLALRESMGRPRVSILATGVDLLAWASDRQNSCVIRLSTEVCHAYYGKTEHQWENYGQGADVTGVAEPTVNLVTTFDHHG